VTEEATESEPRAWLMDMDGVLVHEEESVPGADRFIARLNELGRRYLVLTNNSIYTETILVLTGVTSREEADRFPNRASRIVDSAADLIDDVE
jgi:ribonucleotide monophosphatase NagD (HAD superfamily)